MKNFYLSILLISGLGYSGLSFGQVDSVRLVKTEQQIERNKKEVSKIDRKIEKEERKIKKHRKEINQQDRSRDKRMKKMKKQERELERIKKDEAKLG
jgi:uncharacterized protein HemX